MAKTIETFKACKKLGTSHLLSR